MPNIYPLFKLYKNHYSLKPWKKVHTPIPPVAPAACFCRASWPLHLRCQPLLARGSICETPGQCHKHQQIKKNTCWICVVKQIAYGTIHWHCPRSKKKSLKDYCTLTPFGKGSCRSMWPLHFCCFTPFGKGPLWWHWATPWNQNKAHETIHK